MEKLLIIDGSAIMHRAYHALPPFTAPDGTPTNVLFGFAKMLISLAQQIKPQYLIVAFDTPKPTFRKALFKEYQAQRPKADNDYIVQVPLVQKFLNLAGVAIDFREGFEADDVIGSLTAKAREHNLQTFVATGDKDMLQLVGENVTLVMPKKGVSDLHFVDEKGVVAKLGVKAQEIIDYKALVGDASDNYPGVKGIGPKRAATLLSEYQTFEGIYANLDKIDERTRNLLVTNRENGQISKRLAQIKTDLDLEFDLGKARFGGLTDNPQLTEFLEKLALRSLRKLLSVSKSVVKEEVDKRTNNQLSFF